MLYVIIEAYSLWQTWMKEMQTQQGMGKSQAKTESNLILILKLGGILSLTYTSGLS